ncbi:MAG: MgtC/SapB family protein [Bdellovibrionales bacterium]|nr:MgtC/SapB family protein [Bdellovibrionales bacterium]
MQDTLITIFGSTLLVPAQAKQILFAALIGLIIGMERELRHKPASLRTFATIAVGSCLFAILSVSAGGERQHDVTRIAAQVVSGIGFIGGGVIFKTTDRIEGITTAALIWLTAGLGMACGFNQINLVTWAFAIGAGVHVTIFVIYRILYLFERQPRLTDQD